MSDKRDDTCVGTLHPDNAVMTNCCEDRSVALAHHWLVAMRGGERVLAALAGMFPNAPIHTLIADWRDEQAPPWAADRIRTSWLQKLTWIPNVQRWALPLLPMAARGLDTADSDLVICSDAATVKAIRTRPDAIKICYCHSPMRYVWDLYDEYRRAAGPLGKLGLSCFARRVRSADRTAAQTVTAFAANSRCVADRIARAYGQPSVVIPPPVETDEPTNGQPAEDFYLVVAEQVAYKRTDLAVEACTRLGRRLVVIGQGPELRRLRRLAGPSVELMGWQPEEVVRDHLRRCRALLFCGLEDFGIVPVEAQAAGRPVIAYEGGGALETVVSGQSGLFFTPRTADALVEAILRFEADGVAWSPEQIRKHAEQFSVARFCERFERFLAWCIEQHDAGGTAQVRSAMNDIEPDAFLR